MNTLFHTENGMYTSGYAKETASMRRQQDGEQVKESAHSGKSKEKQPVYGNTIGSPKLSENAQKYYDELKKKYGNMDFILVSNDLKEQAKAMAGSYARPDRTVVLIDEEKIERMASDEAYREKYETIIGQAAGQLAGMKTGLAGVSGGKSVTSYGMQVEDNGTVSFFAVVDKALAAQKERIAKKAEQKKEDRKEAKKEEQKQAGEKRLEQRRNGQDKVTVTVSSIEELIRKIEDLSYADMSDRTMTQEEQQIGQHIDFRG